MHSLVFVSTLMLVALDTSSGTLRRSIDGKLLIPQRQVLEKPRYSNDWAVEVIGGLTVANQLADKHGFVNMGQVGNLEHHYHFQLLVNSTAGYTKTSSYRHIHDRKIGSLAEIGEQSSVTSKLESEDMVGRVEQQRLRKHSKREFVHPTDPNFSRQWSLLNTGQIGFQPFLDLNVERAWMQGITGEGVVVGVVDDGLEHTHPDLRGNYDSWASYDFVAGDYDPTPTKYSGDEPDSHGTSCAGEVGMVKDNNNCGVGVAYQCKIGGLKIDLGETHDVSESSALSYKENHVDVYSNSWGPSDSGYVVSGPGHYLAKTFENGVITGRNGLGSIYIWAAGNGGLKHDSCAADGYASSIYTIAVGSADQTGKQADYDESCSSKMAVTYSYDSKTFPSGDDEWTAYNQITTTTLSGLCTDDFTGTSASAPLMSGVAALALQANSNLTWRDMQYLVVYTSDTTRLVGGDWQTNGRGLKVSHKFGFGAIDAEALVTRARTWTTIPNKTINTVYPSTPGNQYTIRASSSWTTTFNVATSSVRIAYLEHVIVNMTLTISGFNTGYDYSDLESEYYYFSSVDQYYHWLENSHPRRGDIKIQLTSPQGTVSTLLPYRNYDFVNEEGYSDWPFMSVQHWGEDPTGTWTLKVTFRSSSAHVTASGVSMTLHGTSTVPESVSTIPSVCHSACARDCSGPYSSNCDACKDYRVASTLECVSVCPNATYVHNRYCLRGAPQPDHNIIYPGGNKPSKLVYIVSGVAGFGLLLIIIVAVIVTVVACKRSQRSRSRRTFHYSPISPTAV